jgi:hypothetical protein
MFKYLGMKGENKKIIMNKGDLIFLIDKLTGGYLETWTG